MRWRRLESKMLSAVAYDGSKQLLYLRFRNTGDVYRYFHFPAAEYRPNSTPPDSSQRSAPVPPHLLW